MNEERQQGVVENLFIGYSKMEKKNSLVQGQKIKIKEKQRQLTYVFHWKTGISISME